MECPYASPTVHMYILDPDIYLRQPFRTINGRMPFTTGRTSDGKSVMHVAVTLPSQATSSLKQTVNHFPSQWMTDPEFLTVRREPARAEMERRLLPSVQMLLDSDPSLARAEDKSGITPLHNAVVSGSINMYDEENSNIYLPDCASLGEAEGGNVGGELPSFGSTIGTISRYLPRELTCGLMYAATFPSTSLMSPFLKNFLLPPSNCHILRMFQIS